jgi:hypothetical protein
MAWWRLLMDELYRCAPVCEDIKALFDSDEMKTLAELAQAKRRAAFEELTALDPQQAAWLKAMNAHFGKPEAVEVRIDGELKYKRGRFGR